MVLSRILGGIALTFVLTETQGAGAQVVAGSVRDGLTGERVRGAVVMPLGPEVRHGPLPRRAALSGSRSAAQRSCASCASSTCRMSEGFRIIARSARHRTDAAGSIASANHRHHVTGLSAQGRPARGARGLGIGNRWMLAMVVSSADSSQSGMVAQLLYNRLLSNDGRRIIRQSTQRVETSNATPIRADREAAESCAPAMSYYGAM